MRNFGRAFERSGVRCLLISGQATVLYGAAAFSEDVDLWVDPAAGNLALLRRALERLRARVYKLTPPLTPTYARCGHGFHFLLPSAEGPVYLDVMGRPPRVGSFAACLGRSVRMDGAWGAMRVVSEEDLVEIKKTRRLGDYEVISALVRIRLERAARQGRIPPAPWRWGLRNSFSAENLSEMLADPQARRAAIGLRRPALRALLAPGGSPAGRIERAGALLASEIAMLQRDDMRYWGPVLAELRALRARGGLWEEGTPVR
ncbi:MAG: hypothetical protein HY608_07695 [Planctomycetes bacterium]|nr:hypothetical protein [Planctomycetota bacterium]